jgi:hypothetical protein
MNRLRKLVVGLGVSLMFVLPVGAEEVVSSTQDLPDFGSVVGVWYLEKESATPVYVADGTKWEQGTMSPAAQKSATALYGEKGADFLKNIAAYKTFPLSIYRVVRSFTGGTVSVSFKAISGKEDQAAGIAFNIKENGEYLAVRANALENNLILFSFADGKRSRVLDIDNVPTSPQQWHTLKIVIKGNKIEGYVDEKKYLDYTLQESVSGRIGLWSKADSHVAFKSFTVQSK